MRYLKVVALLFLISVSLSACGTDKSGDKCCPFLEDLVENK